MSSCWIAPDGKIIAVQWHRHGKVAAQLIGDTSLDSETAILELAKRGYLHIGPSPFVGFVRYNDLSDEQACALHSVLSGLDGLIKVNILSYIHS